MDLSTFLKCALGMEIYWRDNFSCPTEDEYKLMISRKTGGLFNLAVRSVTSRTVLSILL